MEIHNKKNKLAHFFIGFFHQPQCASFGAPATRAFKRSLYYLVNLINPVKKDFLGELCASSEAGGEI